ncbi:MAG: SIR2 family protein, partial [Myxococcota bacterium]
AKHLATRASQGRLSVFFGAGVSASAGLPTWPELLAQLAIRAGFDEADREGLRRLGPLDQAELIARRFGAAALGPHVRDCLDIGDALGLGHALLAGLPVSEFITTNYDDCFERACAAIGRPVARLPYAPATQAQRWLLKMHGCVSAPDDIVLTRQHYVRYAERNAALAGIVQAMLITRHMLFVGFSLDDDNFHRIVDAVRRALAGSERERLGTVVSLFPNPLIEQLWGDDLRWLSLASPEATIHRAARRFEIFLDYLSFLAATPSHLLNPRFDAVLSPGEVELRAILEPVREWMKRQPRPAADDPVATSFARVYALLADLGSHTH